MDELHKAIIDTGSVLLTSILVIALPILVRELIRWIKFQIQLITGKLTEQQLYALEVVLSLAVRAAEQNGLAGAITNKKEYAVNFADRYLKELGYKIDIKTISDAVEGALWDEINSKKHTAVG